MQVDADGRAWVLTNRRADGRTYVEVYRGTAYVGSVPLDGRVLGIQVVDSILVALAEGVPDDNGIPTHTLDWYQIDQ